MFLLLLCFLCWCWLLFFLSLFFFLVSFFLVFGLLSFLLSFCCGVPSFRIGSGPARVRQVGPVRAESALALPCKRGWWPVVLSVRIRQGMAPHASASINAGTCSACGEKYQLVHYGPVDIPCGFSSDISERRMVRPIRPLRYGSSPWNGPHGSSCRYIGSVLCAVNINCRIMRQLIFCDLQ